VLAGLAELAEPLENELKLGLAQPAARPEAGQARRSTEAHSSWNQELKILKLEHKT